MFAAAMVVGCGNAFGEVLHWRGTVDALASNSANWVNGDGRGWWKPAAGQKVNPQDAVTSPGNLYWCPALTIFIR